MVEEFLVDIGIVKKKVANTTMMLGVMTPLKDFVMSNAVAVMKGNEILSNE